MSVRVIKSGFLLSAMMITPIALLQAQAKPASVDKAAAIEVVPIDKEPSHHLVFENEYVRVFSVEVAPHSLQARGVGRHDHHRERRDRGADQAGVSQAQAPREHAHREAQRTGHGAAHVVQRGCGWRWSRGHDDQAGGRLHDFVRYNPRATLAGS